MEQLFFSNEYIIIFIILSTLRVITMYTYTILWRMKMLSVEEELDFIESSIETLGKLLA